MHPLDLWKQVKRVHVSRGVPDRVIADILGHSKVTTTQAHYLRSDEGQRRRALEQAGDALGL